MDARLSFGEAATRACTGAWIWAGDKNNKSFLVKLFAKSFERRRLFEKRQHPKTFIISSDF
ncbi:hypothetical protein C3920_05475 [Novacetimonas pomaceti]|uniref:Uncharacterized protein n=2 Tax=Novacetimonas pomaceti TaxID=2021998 RepID=A0ABX5P3F0_9PROT|nr:hypothetical protein C3920_05475 [Novacetimonas pomaceti]